MPTRCGASTRSPVPRRGPTRSAWPSSGGACPNRPIARLFLNRWTASEDRLTSLADLRACVTLDGPADPRPGRRYVCGVDLGLKSDRTVAAVCHPERSDGGATVHLDRMAVWQGTPARPVDLTEVETWLAESARTYGAALVFDPWQSVGMCQRLRAQGVRVTEFAFTAQSVGRLAVTLHTAIRDHRLALPDDEALLDELANVRLRETSPGVFRLDHDPDKHDDRATALALAVHNLLERPGGTDWSHLYAERCAGCSALYPATMSHCPTCGTPRPAQPEPSGWATIYATPTPSPFKAALAAATSRRGWFG